MAEPEQHDVFLSHSSKDKVLVRRLAQALRERHLEGQAAQLGNLGNCYRALDDIPRAIEHYERALTVFEKLGSLEGKANALGNHGGCYCSSATSLRPSSCTSERSSCSGAWAFPKIILL